MGLGDRAFFPRTADRDRDIVAPMPFKTTVRRAYADREEKPCTRQRRMFQPQARQKEKQARSNQCAVALGRIKAKPSVAAKGAAFTTCARRRQHPAVGARESLRRGRQGK